MGRLWVLLSCFVRLQWLILSRCHCTSMGNGAPERSADILLTLAAISNRAHRPIWNRNSTWWRDTHVEHPAADLLQDALREIDQEMTTKISELVLTINKWVNISAVVYGFVVFFIKLSILLQYLRIFAPTRKGNMFIYVGVHLCIWTNLIFYLLETVFEIATCSPRKKIWDPLITTGHCFSVNATFQSTGVFNVISDFAILILPMRSVWRLRLPLKKKILMTTVFATGFL